MGTGGGEPTRETLRIVQESSQEKHRLWVIVDTVFGTWFPKTGGWNCFFFRKLFLLITLDLKPAQTMLAK